MNDKCENNDDIKVMRPDKIDQAPYWYYRQVKVNNDMLDNLHKQILEVKCDKSIVEAMAETKDVAKYRDLLPKCTHFYNKQDTTDCLGRFGTDKTKWCSSCLTASQLQETLLNYEALKKLVLKHLRASIFPSQPLEDLSQELWFRATNEM